MGEAMHTLSWALAAAVMFSALCFTVMSYNIEADKQNSFMMQACVSAGGSWERQWGSQFNCMRPR